MKMFIEERPFTWDAKYDVTDEKGTVMYHVENREEIFDPKQPVPDYSLKEEDRKPLKGKMTNVIILFNMNMVELGRIVRRKASLGMDKFDIYFSDQLLGTIESERHLSIVRYVLRMADWRIFGLPLSWDYDILDHDSIIGHAGTEGSDFADSGKYMLDIFYDNNDINALLVGLGMEAAAALLSERNFEKNRKRGK